MSDDIVLKPFKPNEQAPQEEIKEIIEESGQSSDKEIETPPVFEAKAETPVEVDEGIKATIKRKGEEEKPTEIDYSTYLSPKQVDVLKAQWAEENKPKSQFANEQAEYLNNYIAGGGEINERFLRYQSLNFDKFDLNKVSDSMKVLKMELMDTEGYSSEDADYILENKYSGLYNDIDEGDDDYEAKVAMKDKATRMANIDAKRVLPKLKEAQQKLVIPPNEPNEPTKEQIEAANNARMEYDRDASAALSDFKGVTLDMGEGVSIEFEAKETDMGDVSDLLLKPETQNTYFADNYILPDGTRNLSQLVRDDYIRRNFDKIMKSAAVQFKAMGVEEYLKSEGISPNLDGIQKPSGGEISIVGAQAHFASKKPKFGF